MTPRHSYRGYWLQRLTTRSPKEGWAIFSAGGVMVECGLPSRGAAEAELDRMLEAHPSLAIAQEPS